MTTADVVAQDRRTTFARMTLGVECWAALRMDGMPPPADGVHRGWVPGDPVPSAVSAVTALLERVRSAGMLRVEDCAGPSGIAPRSSTIATQAAIEDILRLAERDDLPVIGQAAVVWAQCIVRLPGDCHTFAAALVQTVLRRARVTEVIAVPVSIGLLHAESRHGALVAYRQGRVEPLVALMAQLLRVSAEEARMALTRLHELEDLWRAEAHVREDSVAAMILSHLLDMPSLRAADVQRLARGSTSAYAALDRLECLGILREVTGGRRNRVWVAHDVVHEIEMMVKRIATRVGGGSAHSDARRTI